MKKFLAGMLIIGLLIGGCSKKSSTMTSEEANDIASNFVLAMQYQGTNMVNPGTAGSIAKNMKGPKDTLIISGNTTDNDGDGVTVSGRYEMHMSDTVSFDTLQMVMILDGVITHDDSLTDDDPYAWHVIFNNPDRTDSNFFLSFTSNSTSFEMLYHGDISASKVSNTYTVSLNNFKMKITTDTLSVTMSCDWTVGFTPDIATWHPGDASASGNFTIDGSFGFSNEKSYNLNVETIVPLHITPALMLSSATIDNGKIKLTDANGNVIEITFGAGGTYTVTLNGSPVS